MGNRVGVVFVNEARGSHIPLYLNVDNRGVVTVFNRNSEFSSAIEVRVRCGAAVIWPSPQAGACELQQGWNGQFVLVVRALFRLLVVLSLELLVLGFRAQHVLPHLVDRSGYHTSADSGLDGV